MAIKAVYAYIGGGNASDAIWVTDGTTAGTAQIIPIPLNDPALITAFGNYAVFSAEVTLTDGASWFYRIYVTDGTSAGTTIITPPPSSSPFDFTYEINSAAVIGSKVIASTDGYTKLLVTDGTQAGTSVLSFPTVPVPFIWTTGALYSLGSKVVFAAGNTHSNYNGLATDLWVSDGTSAGTIPLVAANEAASGLDPTDITVFGDKALFDGLNASGNDTVWVTDGTSAGTLQLTAPTLAAAAFPETMLTLGSEVLFEAYDTSNRHGLFITDGTSAGTTELNIALPNSTGLSPNVDLFPQLLISFGRKALFFGDDGMFNEGLWVTDGSAAGTSELSTPTLSFSTPPSNFFAYGSTVLFEGTDSLGKVGLWVTDGTSAGTFEITAGNAYFYGLLNYVSDPHFALAGNDVVFTGTDSSGNTGLWVTNGTSGGTQEISVTSAGATLSPYPSAIASIGTPVFPPSITGSRPHQAVNDSSSLSPFSSVVISDANAGQTESVTVALSAAANGILTNLAGGSYSDSTGVYTVSGSAVSVTAAIQGLIFSPTKGQLPGQTVTTTFTISVNDTAGGIVTDATTSVTTTDITVVLHGSASQYDIANNAGALYLQDSVANRDGTQTLPGISVMQFADGVGVFDPTGTAEQVARLYGATFKRAADLSGLEYWANQVNSGDLSLAAAANGFTGSTEFQNDYGALSNDRFINLMYENVLGRSADQGGLAYWEQQMANGASRGTVVLGFAESEEYIVDKISFAGDANYGEAYRLYQAALDRTPDATGLQYWTTQLAAGLSASQAAQDFINSAEFQTNYGNLTAADFVTTMYENVLHRAPDSAGAQYWVSQMQNGLSQASVLLGFSDSLENRINTAAATHDGWVFIPG